jgi:hypothetical protein
LIIIVPAVVLFTTIAIAGLVYDPSNVCTDHFGQTQWMEFCCRFI